MRVAIIGGGSVGLLFAYYLSRSGQEVTIYVRRENQAQRLRDSGLSLSFDGAWGKVNPTTEILHSTIRIDAELVIIAVKQYHLSDITDVLRCGIRDSATLLFVQNGMGHIALMKNLPHERILAGVVEHGVLKKTDNEIEHTGAGLTKVAALRGDRQDLLRSETSHESFPIENHEDWYALLAEKLLVNAAINPLTALYRVENGKLSENRYFQRNLRRLFDEAFSVLGLQDREAHWQKVLRVCRNTGKNRSSMLRDIERGQATEIDAISGYLLQEGKNNDIALPYTAFVYESVKGISNQG